MRNDFAGEKQIVMSQLQKAHDRMDKINSDYSIELRELQDKIAAGINNLEQEKFRMAFFGSFSDGKSTILSALTRRLDIEIAPEPKTDQVATYEYGDYLIVDTPGLHSEITMHDEATIKFISEANVVILTVDAVNPLRESHRDTIQWLLTDLNKLDATIFVLNKMDSVADLEDEETYENAAKIKIKALEETLNRHLETASSPMVVPVSADPYGMGLSHWLNHENEYLQLSRIGNLDRSLDTFVEAAKTELITKAGLSVLKDSIMVAARRIDKVAEKAELSVRASEQELKKHEKELGTLNQDINRKNRNIRDDLLILREDVQSRLLGASNVEELREVVTLKLGIDGSILNEKIDIIIQKHTDELAEREYDLFSEINESLVFQVMRNEEIHKMMGDAGVAVGEKILAKSTKELAGAVKQFRELLGKAGIKIKFKPWGALKWANRIKKFAKGLPILVEVLQTALRFNEERKFKKERKRIESEINELFSNIMSDLSLENYRSQYFPRSVEMEKALKILMGQKSDRLLGSHNLKSAATELRELLEFENANIDENQPQEKQKKI